jgi:hypothetical protein
MRNPPGVAVSESSGGRLGRCDLLVTLIVAYLVFFSHNRSGNFSQIQIILDPSGEFTPKSLDLQIHRRDSNHRAMSNSMDAFLFSNLPSALAVQKMSAGSIETKVDLAIQRIQAAITDSYDHVLVFSTYWESDNTGGKDDSNLFIKTVRTFQPEIVQSRQRAIVYGDWDVAFANEITIYAQSQRGRQLFILHYAGHARADSTSDNLIIVPTIDQEINQKPQINMTYIKNGLKSLCSISMGLDVLLVMDCCCASVVGRQADDNTPKGARVELMAATSPKGISNSRDDGDTFTEHWCAAFTSLLESGMAFTCTDIIGVINSHSSLEQFPRSFILREGWDIAITFRSDPAATPRLPAAMTTRTIITAFHLQEDPEADSMKKLIKYLENAPIPLTVIAALPVSSTLLVLHVPAFFQELLGLPRISICLANV